MHNGFRECSQKSVVLGLSSIIFLLQSTLCVEAICSLQNKQNDSWIYVIEKAFSNIKTKNKLAGDMPCIQRPVFLNK